MVNRVNFFANFSSSFSTLDTFDLKEFCSFYVVIFTEEIALQFVSR